MTDLSPPEHEHSAAVDEAARWLVETPRHERPRPVVIELRDRFGLNAVDACAAIREAEAIRARAL